MVRAILCLLALAVVFLAVLTATVVVVLARFDDPSAAVLWGALLVGAGAGWVSAYVPWRVAVWRGWIRPGDASEAAYTLGQLFDAFS